MSECVDRSFERVVGGDGGGGDGGDGVRGDGSGGVRGDGGDGGDGVCFLRSLSLGLGYGGDVWCDGGGWLVVVWVVCDVVMVVGWAIMMCDVMMVVGWAMMVCDVMVVVG